MILIKHPDSTIKGTGNNSRFVDLSIFKAFYKRVLPFIIVFIINCACFPVGLGLAFNLQPALTMIGRYFYKKRPIANGLAMAGSPVFLSTLAPLNQYLFNQFGWRGSFMILGGLLLNCCVAGSLMRPLGPPPSNKKKDEEIAAATTTTKEKLTPWLVVNRYLDLSLFKHRGFLIYLSGNVIMFFGFFAPIVFLAAYAKDMGVDEYSAAFLLSILAFVDMFARPSMGLLANSRWVRPKIQYFFSFAVLYNGVCHILCPLVESYTGLVVYAIFFGFAFGMVSSVLFETLMDLVGAQRFSSAVGLTTIVECCPVLLGPPLAGTNHLRPPLTQGKRQHLNIAFLLLQGSLSTSRKTTSTCTSAAAPS